MSRDASEHNGPRDNGEPRSHARVRIGNNGSGPPVHLLAHDQNGRIHLDGFLTIEAAELLRRALNDVLGPVDDDRRAQSEHESLLSAARTIGIAARPFGRSR